MQLSIPLRGQEQPLWCWAAVASALSAVSPNAMAMAPCEIAGAIFNSPCCDDAAACNKSVELVDAMRVANVGNAERTTLQFDEIVRQIDQVQMPIAAQIVDVSSGGGHFVIITGCDANAGTVVVADPFGPAGLPAPQYEMSYLDKFVGDYGGWGRCRRLYLIT